MPILIKNLPSIPFTSLAPLRPLDVLYLSLHVSCSCPRPRKSSVVLPSFHSVLVEPSLSQSLLSLLFPAGSVTKCLEGKFPIIVFGHQPWYRASSGFTPRMQIVVVKMNVDGWIIVFCKMGINSACAGFIGTSTTRADRCYIVIPIPFLR